MRPSGLAISLKISALSSFVVFLVMLMGDQYSQFVKTLWISGSEVKVTWLLGGQGGEARRPEEGERGIGKT